MLIVVFLAFMVAVILLRALNRDITKYNKVRQSPGADTDTHTETHIRAFSPPPMPCAHCAHSPHLPPALLRRC